MVTEAKREEIRKEAKKILGDFASSLKGVGVKEKAFKHPVGGFREECDGEKCDMEFRETMFKNSPESDGDCIIAEKKKW